MLTIRIILINKIHNNQLTNKAIRNKIQHTDPVVHGSRMDDSFYTQRVLIKMGIKAFIDHSGKLVSAALNDWFSSISGNIALGNKVD